MRPKLPLLQQGDKVGRWTLREKVANRWLCTCECGTERAVSASSLVQKASTSCGCRKTEVTVERSTKHNHCHRGDLSKSYKSWKYMKDRVATDPDYADVSICEEWVDFDRFLFDMGETPEGMTLDRIDNNKGYCKENCRWATPVQQANNKTTNVRVVFKGRELTLAEWARELGVNYKTLHNRVTACGWSFEEALSAPVRISGRHPARNAT